ncbi:MAG: AMP-binding protein [Mycobacterium sp.]|nr:AMP-binding protein [Mycobacterium sp.]
MATFCPNHEHFARASLRLLGTVGEPINPEAWEWYYRVVGDSRCPIVDTWWQTETGGIMITPLPGAIDIKPGSATLPFFGVAAGVCWMAKLKISAVQARVIWSLRRQLARARSAPCMAITSA